MAKWLGFLMLCGSVIAPLAAANDLTDALLSNDPRDRYESGTGRVYHDAYGPEEDAEATAAENGVDAYAAPESLGTAYQDLRSPLYGAEGSTNRALQDEDQPLTVDSPDTSDESTTEEPEDTTNPLVP